MTPLVTLACETSLFCRAVICQQINQVSDDTWQVPTDPVNLYPGQPPLFSANYPSLKHRLTQTVHAKILRNRVTTVPKCETYEINVINLSLFLFYSTFKSTLPSYLGLGCKL